MSNGISTNGNGDKQEVEYPLICDPSSPMHDAIAHAKHNAKFIKHPVLIRGETGTGKEGIAHLLHKESGLTNFHVINCATLASGVAGSELFGHEKGSFTGATGQRKGIFEFGDGDTIFLDEITEIPMDIQAQLLRALEYGEIRRVGSSETIKFNARIIAATNVDPDEAIREKRLRRDLYERLRKGPLIELPPLRERTMDIPLLAKHFAKKAVQQYIDHYPDIKCSVPEFSPEAMDYLVSYPWQGNVRSLEGVVNRAALDAQRNDPPVISMQTHEMVRLSKTVTHEHDRTIADIKAELAKLVGGKNGRINQTTLHQKTGLERRTIRSFFDPCNISFPTNNTLTTLRSYCATIGKAEEFDVLSDELMAALRELPRKPRGPAATLGR